MNDPKYIKLFCSEAETHLIEISSTLKTLSDDRSNKDATNTIMGRLHSIKGMSATMGFSLLLELSHLSEDFIASFSDEEIELNDKALKLIYELVATIEKFILSLPEVNDEIIEKMIVKIKRGFEKKDYGQPEEAGDSDQQIKESVDNILSSIDRNIKINVSMIDDLLGDISEIKYTESALKRLNEKLGSYKLKLIIKRVEGQLTKLTQSLIDLKMQPFDTIISQLKRSVDEYCLSTGKKIDFTAKTNDIVIDSTVLKVIISPLIHLMRNAVDHGLESVEERKGAGKPEKGQVSLTVKKIHDFAQITIEDDGRGIPVDMVINKALTKGFIKEIPDTLDDNFYLYVLTRPGFTTKDSVSTVSGRGIGLDVVRSSLENIGGSISLTTRKGEGTVVTLKVPVTTAVIRSLLVKVDKETVAIPSSSIKKVLLLNKDSITFSEKKYPSNFLYQDKTVGIKYLGSLLKVPGLSHFKINGRDEYNLILVDMKDKTEAVLVDDLISEEDLFINPMTRPLNRTKAALGYSILGNGAPVFLLDINGL
jgi:two-component system chemotaxis sensor kinase CheA